MQSWPDRSVQTSPTRYQGALERSGAPFLLSLARPCLAVCQSEKPVWPRERPYPSLHPHPSPLISFSRNRGG